MTWLDIALVFVVFTFLAAGARVGSLWTAACLAGGFLGAMLADLYALPLASQIGSFPGAVGVAGAALFLVGAAAALLPGLLLSRIFVGVLLGVADSAFGIVTGAVAGVLAIAALLLIVVPLSPHVESTRAWKRSAIVRPLHGALEEVFQSPRFRGTGSGLGAASRGLRELEPFKRRAKAEIEEAAEKAIERVKE